MCLSDSVKATPHGSSSSEKNLNKASDGSKTAVSSMSPNNIEHNEPESEIYQIQKNLDNCSKLITDNLLNSNSLFSDLWNLMPNTDRNSNLHLYFSLNKISPDIS
ncbi:unnamed protein product [Heterobilharzia americana]|nr:unnamed protein product [Heterobilharzia americana]